jgi:hypothetical protein
LYFVGLPGILHSQSAAVGEVAPAAERRLPASWFILQTLYSLERKPPQAVASLKKLNCVFSVR